MEHLKSQRNKSANKRKQKRRKWPATSNTSSPPLERYFEELSGTHTDHYHNLGMRTLCGCSCRRKRDRDAGYQGKNERVSEGANKQLSTSRVSSDFSIHSIFTSEYVDASSIYFSSPHLLPLNQSFQSSSPTHSTIKLHTLARLSRRIRIQPNIRIQLRRLLSNLIGYGHVSARELKGGGGKGTYHYPHPAPG